MTNIENALKPTTEQINLIRHPLLEAINVYMHRDNLGEYAAERVAQYLIAQGLATLFPAVPAVAVIFVAGFLARELFGVLESGAVDDFFDPLFDLAEAAGLPTPEMQPTPPVIFRGKDGQNDFINGNEKDNFIYGYGGDDVICGGLGHDLIEGGAGDDALIGENGNDALRGGEGSDILAGGAGADILDGGGKSPEQDTATYFGSAAGVYIDLSTGLARGGHAEGDTLISIENLIGSVFNDVLVGSSVANVLMGGLGDDMISGRPGDDVLLGDEGEDLLFGEQGEDTLHGGAGSDSLYGGSENDALYGGAGNDFLYGSTGDDILDGGEGIDWAYFSDYARGVTVDLVQGFAKSGSEVDTLVAIENASGTRFDDVFIGNGLNNVFDGNDGNDVMVASLGNDTFRGLGGVDTVDYSNFRDFSGNPVWLNIDLEKSQATATLTHAGYTIVKSDYLMEVENAIGSVANDILIGNSADNVLDGGLGADAMAGGLGDDTYVVENYSDVVIEKPTTFGFAFMHYGIDTIRTALSSYSLEYIPNVENLTGTATTGQVLTGNAEYNRIAGGIGDDRIDGGTGDDVLTGGYGDDLFIFRAGSGSDVITDFVSGPGGVDSISLQGFGISSFAQALSFASEDDGSTIFNFGNGDTLTLHDVRMANLVASDLGFADPVVTPPAGEAGTGSPTVPSIIGPVAGVTITGTRGADRIDAGNAPRNQPLPTDRGDTINGLAGNDIIAGLGGNDTINGGAGNDTIDAGEGDDTIVAFAKEAQFDVFIGGAGTDTLSLTGKGKVVLSGLDAAAASIEILNGNDRVLSGNAADNVFDFSALEQVGGVAVVEGAAGNDTLIGSRFADVLRGGAGNDTIDAGEGDDTIIIAGAEAQFDVFTGGAGTDTLSVASKGKVTLSGFDAAASSIEIWSGLGGGVSGNKADNAFDFSALQNVSGLAFVDGGAGKDTLAGSQFADVLRGGAGNDTLTGNAGNDVLTGGAGADTFVFAQGFGHDRITDFAAAGKVQDIITFDSSLFVDFVEVLGHASQVGNAVVITYDAENSLTLDKVKLSALTVEDFAFV